MSASGISFLCLIRIRRNFSVAIAGVLLVFCYLIVPSVGAMLFADRIGRASPSAGPWHRRLSSRLLAKRQLDTPNRRNHRRHLRRRPDPDVPHDT